MFQICLYFPVPLLCATLQMLSHLIKTIPGIEENLVFSTGVLVKKEESADMDLLSNLKKFEDEDDDEGTKSEVKNVNSRNLQWVYSQW